eukprot:364309-Chlamydomonas_euryale.AAC.3
MWRGLIRPIRHELLQIGVNTSHSARGPLQICLGLPDVHRNPTGSPNRPIPCEVTQRLDPLRSPKGPILELYQAYIRQAFRSRKGKPSKSHVDHVHLCCQRRACCQAEPKTRAGSIPPSGALPAANHP